MDQQPIPPVDTLAEDPRSAEIRVRQFREILVWPVQLMPLQESAQIQTHWERLADGDCAWGELADEFTTDCADFKDRHYIEFVSFLPHVQRFLYGEGRTLDQRQGHGMSPIRVFRRHDVAKARVTADADGPTIDFDIAHIDLYFFFDIDVAILAVEIRGEDLTLPQVQETLFRFGRTYPPSWTADGRAAQCCHRVEWIGADGEVLAASDYERKDRYLSYVCRNRAPWIAAHWAWLLRPLVLHHSGEAGTIRYRQLEYQRIPLMAWLAVDDPCGLGRADWVRLGLGSPSSETGALPFGRHFLADFERRHCYDRFWSRDGGHDGPNTRILCTGPTFTMVGPADDPEFTDPERGVLGQFRHEYFVLGLIAHFHRAALLMLSDRLATAISRLDISDLDSVRVFKRDIRQVKEIFLRFNHRYWFHEVSHQRPSRELFRLLSDHLDTERLFCEVREEVEDMSRYLDSDGLRRQANSVLRLTVVTILGLAGTLATSLLGMNLIDAADEPVWLRLAYFAMAFFPVLALVLYTVVKSKRLSDVLESLSDERLPVTDKLRMVLRAWFRPVG